eukprot:scaffold13428_cov42-Phaeocystis_antarctica.AAC.1
MQVVVTERLCTPDVLVECGQIPYGDCGGGGAQPRLGGVAPTLTHLALAQRDLLPRVAVQAGHAIAIHDDIGCEREMRPRSKAAAAYAHADPGPAAAVGQCRPAPRAPARARTAPGDHAAGGP